MRLLRPLMAMFLTALLSACGALSSLNGSGATLAVYTLTPLAFADPTLGRGAHLVVELPTASGALATDRILIKPTTIEAQYLPDGRWVEPVPILIQSLLVNSLQNSGHFRIASRDGAGLMPDLTLMTEVQLFQAGPATMDGPRQVIRIGLLLTLIRESDRSVLAVARFAGTATAATDATPDIVGAFESAMQDVLKQAFVWITDRAG